MLSRDLPRPLIRLAGCAALLGVGFALGRSGGDVGPAGAHAAAMQDGQGVDEATLVRIRSGFDDLRRAQLSLENTGRYVPAANGVNAFATLAGGYDARISLENGTGVDPETYVALEAGFAPGPILRELGRDEFGRLTYRDRLIRLLPRETLREMFLRRQELLGEAL